MSSHHIVRDDQEPALLIAGHIHSLEYLHQLLEWSPTIIVCQKFVEEVMLMGIKIDVVLCEIGQQEYYKEKVEHQLPVKLVAYKSLQEPVVVGISYLTGLNYPAVHVLADVDSQLLDQLSRVKDVNVTASDGLVRWLNCPTGVFKKWMPKNSVLLLEKGSDLNIRLESRVIEKDCNGFCKIAIDEEGMVELSQERPFWLGEYIN